MKKHLHDIHEDPSTTSSSSIPGNGSLLLNDFNYDLRMMKVKLNSEPRITPVSERLCFSPRTPLSNVSTIFDSNIKECTWGQSRSLLNTAQTLDFDMGRDFAQSDRTMDEMDYSRIVGFDVQEPDFYSDEDAVPIEYASLGAPNIQCDKCEACMWKEERTNKNVKRGCPEFSLCCAKGQIQLPKEKPTPSYLWQLYNDSKKGPRFKEGIRLYNSLFAFISTGGRVDHSINCSGAPYIYRLNGQNHHLFGSLIPDDGQDTKFCQLYIYDTENEVRNQMKWINVRDGQTVHAEIVEGLMKMLDEKNELVKEFRTQRDRFKEGEVTDLEITLKVSRAEDGRENHVGPSDEIAGIMVGDLDDNCGFRDIVIHSYEDDLRRISDIHPKLMTLQYPLMFPHSDDGFHVHLSYGSAGNKSSKSRSGSEMKKFKNISSRKKSKKSTSVQKNRYVDLYDSVIREDGDFSAERAEQIEDSSVKSERRFVSSRLFVGRYCKVKRLEQGGGEQSKSKEKIKRIDLAAAKIVKEKGKEVNTSNRILGAVPGVEVSDEFQYRVELAIVGIHRFYQAGKDKQPEDQKLERGNLALKNSNNVKNNMRVIRGSKEIKASESVDARAKTVMTYVYDGLYTVERFWQEEGALGKLVFKFELRRLPGQPEIPWKEVKKSNKSRTREGLCVDISGRKEIMPICAVNTLDDEKPPPFTYVTKMTYRDSFNLSLPKGCDCKGGC
ncbi:hypothetical protein POM88_033888 [Heracleum sosnowskyi]|uniref:YDG domain-containing protein n=1 Tax=Heracleum sosnowskyi TaxID=360622 RepID=A0AAD8HJQ6_9APIA|nr:hypothetical protein POM88_033888 [Heracleum sosnowskyi]